MSLAERVKRERTHSKIILEFDESNWGWNTPAGAVRKQRRAEFLTQNYKSLHYPPKVLEVGCGTGTFTGYLAEVFHDLTSIDVSDDFLSIATSKFPQVRFENRDIHQSEFSDRSFDLILGCSVLHHLDWDLAIQEIGRILRPGGQIRFSEPNLMNPQIYLQRNVPWIRNYMGDSPDEYAFTASQIRRSLSNAGFSKIDVVPYEFLHPSTPQSLINWVIRLETLLEKTLIRHIAGSLKISAIKPF